MKSAYLILVILLILFLVWMNNSPTSQNPSPQEAPHSLQTQPEN